MRLTLAKFLRIALLCAITVSVIPAVASAAATRAKVGSVPPLPRGAKTTTVAVPATQKVSLTVAMQPRDPAGLQALATEVSTPGSAEFRHYLTVPEFAAQFGASPLALQAVESTLRAEGLDVGTPTANDLTLPVTGTAAQAEQAFSVSLKQVKLRSGRTAYANAEAPTLPSRIAPFVEGVLGLDNVNPDQPAGLQRRTGPASNALARTPSRGHVLTNGGPQPCAEAAATQQNGGLTADEIATAYQFSGLYGAGNFGAGQTIAMFEEQAYNPTDIATYQACYGTNVPITNVDVAGGPTPGGDDGESALDIEQAIGLAPRANIVVYQGPFSATVQIISTIVSQNVAKVISSSYGICEALTGGTQINAESPLLQEAAVQGQSFFISSGDSGSTMCYQATRDSNNPNLSLSVIDPGGQQFATGVGGTILFQNGPNGPAFYTPGATPVEGVWTDPHQTDSQGAVQASGSGGGISSFFSMPSYQSSAPASLNVDNPNSSSQPCGGSTFCREVPDVAADADPNTGYAIFSNGAWGVTGGTSAAAPLWAAYTSLVNSSSTCRGTPVGFVNPALYSIAGSSYLNNFTDITTANPISGQASNNALYEFSNPDNPNGLYPLQTGYDMATGLGSMLAPHLAAALCSIASPVFSVSVASPGNQTATVGMPVSVAIRAADSGGQALGYAASGLPAGLTIDAANGVISGTPTAAGTTVVTIAAADRFTNRGATSFSWTVLKPPTAGASNVSLKGIGDRKPKLTFTLKATNGQPALKSVSISLPSGLKFAGKAKTLKKGISVKNGKKVKFKTKGKLTISFNKSQRKVTVTIKRPALSVSKSLAKKVRKHKVKKLTVNLKALNTSNRSSKLAELLRVK